MQNRQKYKINIVSMTMIEVLIAIWVFGVWIVWVMATINMSLSNMSIAKTKITSSMIAREWLESIYQKRNTNIIKMDKWDNVYEDYNFWYFTNNNWQWLKVSIGKDIVFDKITLSPKFEENIKNSLIYWKIENINWKPIYIKDHQVGDLKEEKWEKFGRYIVFENINFWENNDGNLEKLLSGKAYKVSSISMFQFGAKTWEIKLESIISNYSE